MMGPRIGTFFFIVGLGLVVLFVLSDMGDRAQFGFFVLGILGILVGVAFWWRAPSAPPPPPSGRFRVLKSLGSRDPKKGKKK